MRKALCLSLFVLICGCAERGRTSLVSSAAGGLMGAGLGAVVGNQVGSAGSGLLIGAVAGTSAGAAIGATLEDQEQVARSQDEAIERHERTIQAQRSELVELRRMTQDDSAGVRRSTSLRTAFAPSLDLKPRDDHWANSRTLSESQILDQGTQLAPSAAARLAKEDVLSGNRWDRPSLPAIGVTETAQSNELIALDQCGKAAQELQKSEEAPDSADKLFHLRRAIRLCPEQPRYRTALGDYYAANNRVSDAKAEYERANKLEPNSVSIPDRLRQFARY